MGGFVNQLGICSPMEAELWGALEGLKLAWGMGMKQIILESDSAKIVGLLNGSKDIMVRDRNLLASCLKMVKEDWQLKVAHTYREANRSAG